MMLKIESREEKERKRGRLQLIFAIIVVVILAASTASYALISSDSKTEKYNGKRVYQTETGWQVKGLEFTTSFLPQEVENLSLEGTPSIGDFYNKVYAISPYSRNALSEWARIVPMTGLQLACLPEQANDPACQDLPLKSCDDAGPQNAILVFQESNETSAKYSRGCLEIFGDENSMIQMVDKIAYVMSGTIAN